MLLCVFWGEKPQLTFSENSLFPTVLGTTFVREREKEPGRGNHRPEMFPI